MGVQIRPGDIFSVKIDDEHKKYFQYITDDLTQLNSNVIRCFKKKYPLQADVDLSKLVQDEVEFYGHCIIKLGVKMGYWEKVGSNKDVGNFDHVLFRDSGDFGNPKIKISTNWWVWKIGEPQVKVGKLEGKNIEAEIG